MLRPFSHFLHPKSWGRTAKHRKRPDFDGGARKRPAGTLWWLSRGFDAAIPQKRPFSGVVFLCHTGFAAPPYLLSLQDSTGQSGLAKGQNAKKSGLAKGQNRVSGGLFAAGEGWYKKAPHRLRGDVDAVIFPGRAAPASGRCPGPRIRSRTSPAGTGRTGPKAPDCACGPLCA